MGHSPIGYTRSIAKCLHKVRSPDFKGAGLTVSHQISILSHTVHSGIPKTKRIDPIYILHASSTQSTSS